MKRRKETGGREHPPEIPDPLYGRKPRKTKPQLTQHCGEVGFRQDYGKRRRRPREARGPYFPIPKTEVGLARTAREMLNQKRRQLKQWSVHRKKQRQSSLNHQQEHDLQRRKTQRRWKRKIKKSTRETRNPFHHPGNKEEWKKRSHHGRRKHRRSK